MSLTFIDTNKLAKKASAGQGEVTEVLNEVLCGAPNVRGSLRWSNRRDVQAGCNQSAPAHLSHGRQGQNRLNNRDYNVEKGAGIYLGPAETATIQAASGASLKLFHLVVPQIPK